MFGSYGRDALNNLHVLMLGFALRRSARRLSSYSHCVGDFEMEYLMICVFGQVRQFVNKAVCRSAQLIAILILLDLQ